MKNVLTLDKLQTTSIYDDTNTSSANLISYSVPIPV